MLSIFLAVLALCLLVVVHEFGHFLVARLCRMRVDRFSIGFGPAIWSKKIGETIYQIGPIPLGGYVQIAGLNPDENLKESPDPQDPRLYHNRPAWQRFFVVLAGPFINYLFAFLVVLGLNLSLGVPTVVEGVSLGQVFESSVAAKAGLQMKDKIVSVDGEKMADPDQFVAKVKNSKGQPLSILIKRGSVEKMVVVTPLLQDGTYRLGVMPLPGIDRQHHGIFNSLSNAVMYPILLTQMQLQGFKRLFSDKKALEGVGGPVQIVSQLKTQIRSGLVDALEALALISTALGFFNLLPIPSLDGGRLLFLGWEIVSRRPISKKVEQWIHVGGIILLFGLILLVTFRDVFRLIKNL